MSARVKFVLILTSVVSLILLFCFFVIYTLYAHSRKEDFNKRLWAHAYNNYKTQYLIPDTSKEIENRLANYLPGSPIDFKLALLDGSYSLLRVIPDTFQYSVDTALLQSIKKEKEFYFGDDGNQSVGLYFINNTGEESYVIASGYDQYGLARLATLRLIMLTVAAGGVLTIALFALNYVNASTKPLISLSEQISHITVNNLKEKVTINKTNVRHTEIIQIASNFNDMLERLEKAFQFQKNFVHHASHELRTPLATMLSQTESALRKDLTITEAKKVLESLKEDQQEMIDLTNSLLLLSQYENVQYSPNWPRIRMDEIIYDTISSAQKMFSGIGINFNFSREPEKESYMYIPGNETLLRSAFRNLVKNAYLYSDDGNVDIALEVYQDLINIHFVNKGQVIATEDQERMFLPFFRGGNTKNKRGFGLGLSIVKRITELHKGTVSYAVENNNLNKFTLSFYRL
jgi:signal transduction histidine kinase